MTASTMLMDPTAAILIVSFLTSQACCSPFSSNSAESNTIHKLGERMIELQQTLQSQTIAQNPFHDEIEFDSMNAHYEAVLKSYKSHHDRWSFGDFSEFDKPDPEVAVIFCSLIQSLVEDGFYSAEAHCKITHIWTLQDLGEFSDSSAVSLLSKAMDVFLSIEGEMLYWNVARQLMEGDLTMETIQNAKDSLAYLIDNYPPSDARDIVSRIDALLIEKCIEHLRELWLIPGRIYEPDYINSWMDDFRRFQELNFFVDPKSRHNVLFDAFNKAFERFQKLKKFESVVDHNPIEPDECPICFRDSDEVEWVKFCGFCDEFRFLCIDCMQEPIMKKCGIVLCCQCSTPNMPSKWPDAAECYTTTSSLLE